MMAINSKTTNTPMVTNIVNQLQRFGSDEDLDGASPTECPQPLQTTAISLTCDPQLTQYIKASSTHLGGLIVPIQKSFPFTALP
jgi:hypothetical protein